MCSDNGGVVGLRCGQSGEGGDGVATVAVGHQVVSCTHNDANPGPDHVVRLHVHQDGVLQDIDQLHLGDGDHVGVLILRSIINLSLE